MKDIIVKDTDENLELSFKRKKSINENGYPDFIKDAEDDGEKAAAFVFTHARDAEIFHAKLYERAMFQSMKIDMKAYQVCCFVTDKKSVKKMPRMRSSESNSKQLKFECNLVM